MVNGVRVNSWKLLREKSQHEHGSNAKLGLAWSRGGLIGKLKWE